MSPSTGVSGDVVPSVRGPTREGGDWREQGDVWSFELPIDCQREGRRALIAPVTPGKSAVDFFDAAVMRLAQRCSVTLGS